MNEPLKPPVDLLVKLASIAVHVEELLPCVAAETFKYIDGVEADKSALWTLIEDPRRQLALDTLNLLAKAQPELRICQIVGNALGAGDHYYVTDDKLLLHLEAYAEWSEIENKTEDFISFLKQWEEK